MMGKDSVKAADILIVENDESTASAINALLHNEGYLCDYCLSISDAVTIIRRSCPRLILLDLSVSEENALESMVEFKRQGVLEVIVISGNNRPEYIRQCLTAGAYDFISQPASSADILASVRRVNMLLQFEQLQPGTYPFQLHPGFGSLEGKSKISKRMFSEIRAVGKSLSPGVCLITGPAGSLKNDIAASVHYYSPCQGPAYLINCAGEDDEKAVTRFKGVVDAKDAQTPGYFQMAKDGVLVLDDLSTLRMELQTLLVDYLTEKEYTPINTDSTQPATCSIIGVLRENPQEAIEQERLNARLFALLSANAIEVPGLLQRIEDIGLFAQYAVKQLNAVFGTEKGISAEFMRELSSYEWPGGLVECRNIILMGYRLTEPGEEITSQGLLFPKDKPVTNSGIAPFIGMSLRDAEQQLIKATLAEYDNNKRKVADILGISVKTLYNRLKSYP